MLSKSVSSYKNKESDIAQFLWIYTILIRNILVKEKENVKKRRYEEVDKNKKIRKLLSYFTPSPVVFRKASLHKSAYIFLKIWVLK
jgi:hypothetical protein